MIINKRKENIKEYNYNFPNDLCIYSFSISMTDSWDRSIKLISDYIIRELRLIETTGHVYLWVKTDSFMNPSKLKRKKSIWNYSQLSWLVKDQCILFSHNDKDGEFYTSIAKLNNTQICEGLNFTRTNNNSFLFITNNNDFIDIDSYLSINSLDFERIVNYFYCKDALLIRTIGNFDDRYLCVDFFGKKEFLNNLFQDTN